MVVVLKMFQINPCIFPGVSWKFQKNPFIIVPAMLLTNMQQPKPTNTVET